MSNLKWNMNPIGFEGEKIKVDWASLAQSFRVTLIELNTSWNNGNILVFDGLDAMCQFYTDAGIEDATDALKVDIKDESVVYTQHLFFMW